MKKITLLACTLAISVAMFAGINEKLVKKSTESRKFVPTIRMVETQSSILSEGEDINIVNLQNRAAAMVSDTMIVPYIANGTYNSGTPSSGVGFVNEAAIITPYQKTLTFENYYGLVSSWYVNDELVANDSILTINLPGLGETYPLPVMKTATLPTSDTSQIVFKDYQFGAYYTSKYADYGFENYIEMPTAYIGSLTKCAMYTEVEKDSKGKDTYGSDWKFVGGGPVGTYSYGTNMVHPTTGVRYDTIFVPYFQEGTIYIDHLSLGVYTAANGGVAGMFPGENDHVRASIYPLSATGKINFNEPIARAVATAEDYIGVQSSSSWYGILTFNFVEEDPITGAEQEVPAIINGNFVIAFDEYNDSTADLGFITDYFTEIEGDTYLIGGGKMTQLWSTPSNLLLNLHAILPAFDAPEQVTFELAGGELVLDIPSNVWDDETEIETDEWINVTIATDYEYDEEEDYYTHLYNNKLTISVGAADEARTGEIQINAMGLPVTIKVQQGENPGQAIDNVDFKHDGKNYNVLGIEVNDDYKGVIIRNGEKFIR